MTLLELGGVALLTSALDNWRSSEFRRTGGGEGCIMRPVCGYVKPYFLGVSGGDGFAGGKALLHGLNVGTMNVSDARYLISLALLEARLRVH